MCTYWLDEELVWGVEMVIEEPSSPENSAEARWAEFTGEMNTCSLSGPGWALLCGWGSSSVPGEENRLIHRKHRKRLNSASVTAKARAKQSLQDNQVSGMKCIKMYPRRDPAGDLPGRGRGLPQRRGDKAASEEDNLRAEEG